MAYEPLETAEGTDYPYCIQLSVFVENRLGQLLRLTRLFERGDILLRAVAVEASVDCAIVRLLVDRVDLAQRLLRDAGFALTETEVLVVEMPEHSRGVSAVCEALISGEININYIYALLPLEGRSACVAIQVDDMTQAAAVLRSRRMDLLDQSDL